MIADAKDLVLIFGSVGFDREVVSRLRTDPAVRFDLTGFIDDAVTSVRAETGEGSPVMPGTVLTCDIQGN
jgi:hypothetical protein